MITSFTAQTGLALWYIVSHDMHVIVLKHSDGPCLWTCGKRTPMCISRVYAT